MKKLLALLLVFLMLVATFTGCSDKEAVSSEPQDDTADVSSEPEEDVSSEPEVDVSSEPEVEEPSSAPQYDYEEPEEEPEEEEEFEAAPLTPVQQRYENILEGIDERFNKSALASEGELGRFVKAIEKAKKGETVKIVVYGQGANTAHNTEYAAVAAYTTYSDLLKEWFEANIGPCEVYKAGSYGLTSKLACLRVEHDVLRFEPDVVFLDFSIVDAFNASSTSNSYAYDNLVRRILESKSAPAVATLILPAAEITSYKANKAKPEPFVGSSKQQKEISAYYNIPVIDCDTAFWDGLAELVEVTTQIEKPILKWSDVSMSAIIYKETVHSMLLGPISYIFTVAQAKAAATNVNKNYKYPTEGYFGSDEYMNTSFVNVTQIVEGTAKGYAFDLDFVNGTEEELYAYKYNKNDNQDGRSNSISTSKHFIAETEADKAKEVNPHYLKLTLPEVKEDTYLMFITNAGVNSKACDISALNAYAPIAAVCKDASGNLTHSGKCVRVPDAELGKYTESPNCGKTSALLIPAGTTEIELRIYDRSGATVYFLGVATK